jgi:serine/threonine-protein kinase
MPDRIGLEVPGPPRPNTLVDGRYRLLEPLGSGSMGYVYRALDVDLERPVAIKFIEPNAAKDGANIERFRKEAKALAQLRHDNVVRVYTFGPHDESVYFAMEYVAGQSLESLVDEHNAKGETIDLERTIGILRAVASGLAAVHEAQLVHRDVKPSNIVLENGTGRPVLIDFGLARRKSASNPKMSITAGTPSYMAPEQARDPDGTKVTFRADIYAFACTAYEMLTGKPVFDGADIYQVILKHIKDPPPALSATKPELQPLDAAFERALSKDPPKRHESCAAFAAEIDAGYSRMIALRTAAATTKTRAMVGPEESVLVLVADPALKRRLEKVIDKTLEAVGRTPSVQWASTIEEAWEALRADARRIFVIDDEGLRPSVGALVANLRRLPGGGAASVLVLSRAFGELRVKMQGVDVIPKPLSPQMLASAIERIVARRSIPGT